jgi:hypothetical protein
VGAIGGFAGQVRAGFALRCGFELRRVGAISASLVGAMGRFAG